VGKTSVPHLEERVIIKARKMNQIDRELGFGNKESYSNSFGSLVNRFNPVNVIRAVINPPQTNQAVQQQQAIAEIAALQQQAAQQAAAAQQEESYGTPVLTDEEYAASQRSGEKNSGLGTGAIIGISVGAVLIIGVGAYFIFRK